MQTTLRAAFAIAMLASAVSTADQALAAPLAAPRVLGAAAANAGLIVRVTSVCSVGGCAPVLTRRVQHQPKGFAQRAAPLVIAKPAALAPLNATK